MRYLSLLLICLFFSFGCSKDYSQVVEIPEPLEDIKSRSTQERTNGSLWSSDSNSMFADHKARHVGDIVTVTIAESASASKEATTSANDTSNYQAGIPNFLGLETKDFVANTGITLANLVNASGSSSFEGSGKTVRKGDLTASLTTQVIGRYPNGNFKIRGGKEVMVNDEVQIIYLTGIIRPVDITAANTIDSSKVLNARISYTGRGVISDKQHQGWMTRILDNVWPF
jgi:flagellar L-ring protein FlgH